MLKKSQVFLWDKECNRALTDLKEYLSHPPLSSILEPHEQLFIYLAASSKAVSVALIKKDNGMHKQVYYVSKSLVGNEISYLPIEKLVLAMITTSRFLGYYFDAHPTKVLTKPHYAELIYLEESRSGQWNSTDFT